MKPTLFILAAGIGSRYGGLKQLDSLGPNGETLIDYSVYDALQAGFGKIVFVIRKSFEDDFRKKIASKYAKLVQVEIVYQELDDLPNGFHPNPERDKPWGTNHAVLMGKSVINEPFGVINAQDFYGRESFQLLAGQLRSMQGKTASYCAISYLLGNTLTDSGSVTRGICEVDADNKLLKIDERSEVKRLEGTPQYKNDDGTWKNLTDTTPVSMNMWGFTPDYFDLAEAFFIEFLKENKDKFKAEFRIPVFINALLKDKLVEVKLINTPSKWFGIIYAKDRPEAILKLKDLVNNKVYPENLFK